MSPISRTTQDYLKAIYELQVDAGRVSTNALADRLNLMPASVTGMLKRLSEDEPRLIHYERHHGVTLTAAGQKIALEIIRHHRLIEAYLEQALGYSWDQVDAEAEKLEHFISEDFEERIAAVLGQPTHDPHGDPIPAKDGTIAPPRGQRLSAMTAGQRGRVVRVRDDDPALLRYLAELGIVLNVRLSVAERAPFQGPLHVSVGGRPAQALGQQVTDKVFVVIEQ